MLEYVHNTCGKNMFGAGWPGEDSGGGSLACLFWYRHNIFGGGVFLAKGALHAGVRVGIKGIVPVFGHDVGYATPCCMTRGLFVLVSVPVMALPEHGKVRRLKKIDVKIFSVALSYNVQGLGARILAREESIVLVCPSLGLFMAFVYRCW